MEDYIRGDPRFTGIGHKKKDIVFAWTRKEFSNLRRAREAGVAVPEPIATHRNILVMQFLGENEIAYPLLKDTRLENEEAKTVFYRICNYMRLLYKQAKLVHGDLSEYNILINPSSSEPYIIDMGQAVTPEHPGAEVFLKRDLKNIIRHFRKYGIRDSEQEVYAMIKADDEAEKNIPGEADR
jgi:RIO kinase 1